MNFRRIACLLLACILLAGSLAGCQKKASGDMEKALQALKWEDYDTAFAEASAFVERVPHSNRARAVLETAAWNKLALMEEHSVELSQGRLVKNLDGFTVTDLPEDADETYHLGRYTVTTYQNSEYFYQDVYFSRVNVGKIELEWKYADDWGYESVSIYGPGYMSQYDIIGALDSQVSDSLAAYLQETLAASLNEVFQYFEKEEGIKPEHLGFVEWNMTE